MTPDIAHHVRRVLSAAAWRGGELVGVDRVSWQTLESIRRPEWLYRGGIPRTAIEFRTPAPATAADVALCERLIAAFARTSDAGTTTGMWSWIADTRQGSLADALRERNARRLADLLASMFQSEFVVGMAAGSLGSRAQSRVGGRIWGLRTLDGLVSLGEAIGAIPAETPEQGSPGRSIREAGVDGVAAAIEERLGVPLGFPDIGAPFGIRAGERVIPIDWPEQAYGAVRLRDALRGEALACDETTNVVEIGAGYGGMAYWFARLCPAIGRYTIVDLPIVNVIHGYFLARALGPRAVSFFGEEPAQIAVVPDTALSSVAAPVQAVANKDSMPEMTESVMDEYLRWAARTGVQVVFSYNQEASVSFHGERQGVVADGIARVGGFRRIRRDASWVRRGYVEEIYVARGG
jgi:hypothetical protein